MVESKSSSASKEADLTDNNINNSIENASDDVAPPREDGVAPVGGGIDALEIFRKSMHMGPAMLPFIFHFFVAHPDPLDQQSLIFVASLITFLACIFLAFFKLVRRPGESNFLSTVISYPAIICLTLLIFPGNAEFTCVVVIILALGDGAACILDRKSVV